MSRVSETLLAGTGEDVEVTGAPISVFGCRRFTVAIHTANLKGLVHIEATLAVDPTEDDWFPVFAPLSYPRQGVTSKSDALGKTFKGSFSFIRARLSRPGVPAGSNSAGSYGIVDRVLLNR